MVDPSSPEPGTALAATGHLASDLRTSRPDMALDRLATDLAASYSTAANIDVAKAGAAAALAVEDERRREYWRAKRTVQELRQKASDIHGRDTSECEAAAMAAGVHFANYRGYNEISAEEEAAWAAYDAAKVEEEEALAKFRAGVRASGTSLNKALHPPARLGVALELVDAGRRLASLARHRGMLLDLAVDNLAAGAAKLTGLAAPAAAEIIRGELPADDLPVPPIFYNDEFGAIADFVRDQIGPVRATGSRQLRDVLDTLVQVALDEFALRGARDGAVVGPDKKLKAEVVDQLLARLRADALVAAGVGGRLLEGKRTAIAGPGRPNAPAIEPPLWAQIGEALAAEKGSRELKDDVWAPFAGLGVPKNKFFEHLKKWGKARDVEIKEAKLDSPRVRYVIGVRLLKIV